MRRLLVALLLSGLSSFGVGATAFAQSNTINGLDALLHDIKNIGVDARKGTYPHGVSGISYDCSVCNVGSVKITWQGPMRANHPCIAFLIARDYNGRFEQISDRSDIKHTFAASNDSQCSTCTDSSNPSVLAVGCSDTYDGSENGDRFWLAPAAELDPWLGIWDPVCSHFDAGEPPAAPPDDCDGVRSLSRDQVNHMGPMVHRCAVHDGDLNVTGATFYFAGEYLFRGEADSLRDNNEGTREFTASWNGSTWNLTETGSVVNGPILANWSGASVTSNKNGDDDGRVFVGCTVKGPGPKGYYHYEYAVHNRDNSRAISAFSLPILPGASVINVGFKDVDKDTTNEWTSQIGSADLTWSTTDDPLEWNTIYNFWFDSTAAPSTSARALLTEARAGAGLPAFDVVTTAPIGPAIGTDQGSGKTGGSGLVPDLAMAGGLDVGETAELMVRYAAPAQPAFLFLADTNQGFDFHGGTILPYPPDYVVPVFMDGAGELMCPVDGVGGSFDLFLQFVVIDPAAPGGISMTNALEITL